MAQRHRTQQAGKKSQSKHGFVERFFRVTPTRNAAFISKLFSMVDDETTQDLITWTGSGDQFTVFNNTEFSRTVLPRYFKHCNWSSFVRQLNMYDFHKINENNNDEEINTNEVQTQRWDFKHPWFNKAGFDRLHKIRRKPPRNRLIPQIRYSSAMEILPSNSPDYEVDPSSLASENSPVSDSASVSAGGSGGMHSQHNTGVQDAINQLQGKTGHLESKLDFTANEVQYLRKVTENQQEILNDLLASVEYLKSKYDIPDNAFSSHSRKPRKIHERSNADNRNMEFQYNSIDQFQGGNSTSRYNDEK